MPVVEKFTYSWPEGVTPVTHFEWINRLSPEDRARYDAAAKRQHDHRAQAIAEGRMIMDADNHKYTWRDDATAKENKPTDPEWLEFWYRYLEETQTIFKTEWIEE